MTPHSIFQDLSHTVGPAADREATCVLCLDDVNASQPTLTHTNGKCLNIFHEQCFNRLISDAQTDPAKKGVPKCPICREQFPRIPVFGPPPAPSMLTQRERDRIERQLQEIEVEWEISFPGVGPDRAIPARQRLAFGPSDWLYLGRERESFGGVGAGTLSVVDFLAETVPQHSAYIFRRLEVVWTIR
jgi:Ring finger domain